MPIVQVAPVTRLGMKLLISLFGLSETGKTLSALLLAAGIEPDPAKRGLLDTEGGQRGRAYVDHVPGGYMYGDLSPPFTPERYVEALKDFIAAGVTTLVVDSGSHAWVAEGGILDMVENATEKNDLAKWSKPKRRYGKMARAWMSCGIHLIVCSRAKQPLIEARDENNKKIYVPGPIVPVQEKELRYDFTIMAQMLGDGHFSIAKQDGGKCPGVLRPIFAAGEVVDQEMGKKLIAWIGGQDARSPAQRKLIMDAGEEAVAGTAALQAWWKALSKADQLFMKEHLDNFKSQAAAADRERQLQAAGEQPDTDADPFATRPALDGGVQRVLPTQDAA